MKTPVFGVLITVLSALFGTNAFSQGSLSPPGPPAPTLKTLEQLEPRTPVDAVHTPGDANYVFIITNAGSYYLTTNLNAASSKSGIRINADGVTLDLNGFELNGAGVGNVGIQILSVLPRRQNVTIRNGTVRNWILNGVDLSFGRNALVEKLLVSGIGGTGISVPENSIVRDCLAVTNATAGFASGISAAAGSVIVSCVAQFNGNNSSNGFGIAAGSSCTITHCAANQNAGANGGGISAGLGCTIVDCAAGLNTGSNGVGIVAASGCTVEHCTASGNSGANGVGVVASQRARIEGCTASDNGGDGIRATNDCSIVNNTCANNGAAGIHTTGAANRIDSNHVIENISNGIKVDGVVSLIVRNSARGSGANNFTIAPSNNDAQRIGGGTAFTSTDPWANFSY